MLLSVFEPLCINCGERAGFHEAICDSCLEELARPSARCESCGYIMASAVQWCRHCESRGIIDRYYSDYIYTGALRDLLLSVKFGWRLRGAAQLGELCRLDGIDVARYDCIVPVPSHPLRWLMRYRHPVNIIASAVAEHLGLDMQHALKRMKYTDYQARLSRTKRQRNVQGAFALRGQVKGLNILLIDDVLTTGATAMQAAKTLQRGGAAMIGLYTLMAGVPR